MSNVIKGPWEGAGGGKGEKPSRLHEEGTIDTRSTGKPEIPPEAPEKSAERAFADRVYAGQHPEEVEAALARTKECEDFIFRIREYISNQQTIERERGSLSTFTLEDLCGLMINGREGDWRRTPAFYQAIARELQSRLGAAIAPRGGKR